MNYHYAVKKTDGMTRKRKRTEGAKVIVIAKSIVVIGKKNIRRRKKMKRREKYQRLRQMGYSPDEASQPFTTKLIMSNQGANRRCERL